MFSEQLGASTPATSLLRRRQPKGCSLFPFDLNQMGPYSSIASVSPAGRTAALEHPPSASGGGEQPQRRHRRERVGEKEHGTTVIAASTYSPSQSSDSKKGGGSEGCSKKTIGFVPMVEPFTSAGQRVRTLF